MSMWLNGSAQTGKKIMSNLTKFNASFREKQGNLYFFDWTFDNYQTGSIVIKVIDNEISSESAMNCKENKRDFLKSLGLYNDSSLKPLFEHLLTLVTQA